MARSKQQILAELAAAVASQRQEHKARLDRVGSFLFPPPPEFTLTPDKDTDPHMILEKIDKLIRSRQPIPALEKIIQVATAKKNELARKKAQEEARRKAQEEDETEETDESGEE